MSKRLQQQQRQAVSGVLAAVVLIGITVSLAALVLTFGSDFTESVLIIEPVSIVDLSIRNAGDTSYVHATVKNTGSVTLEDPHVIVIDGPNSQALEFDSNIAAGDTASVTKALNSKLSNNKEVLTQVNGTASGNLVETDIITVRVSKN